MINVRGPAEEARVRNRLLRTQDKLSASLQRDMRKVLLQQFREAASLVSHGVHRFDSVYNENDVRKSLLAKGIQVADTYSAMFFNEAKEALGFEKKGVLDEFWHIARAYIARHSVTRAKNITNTTRNTVRKIIDNGLQNGDSNKVIAQRIISTSSLHSAFRAARIARTEIHSVMTYSLNTSAETSGVVSEKQWSSANDERTRRKPYDHLGAHGETIKLDKHYERTGETLKLPGDPDGSAGNIILCRCVEIYLT